MAKKADISAVSGELVAACCGISRRTHNELVRDGLMPRPNQSKKYDLVESVRAFLVYRENQGPADLREAALAKTLEETRKLRIANELKLGTLTTVDLVATLLGGMTTADVGHLESIPGRVAAELENKSADFVRTVLLREIRAYREVVANRLRDMEDFDRMPWERYVGLAARAVADAVERDASKKPRRRSK